MQLKTELTDQGIKLTTTMGDDVGVIVYEVDHGFTYRAPDGFVGPLRKNHLAAEYDALAWAHNQLWGDC